MESGVQFAMKHGTVQKLMLFVGNLDLFLLVSRYFIKIEFRNYRLKYHVLFMYAVLVTLKMCYSGLIA